MTVDEIKMRLESIAEWLDEDLPTHGDVEMAKDEIAELRQLLQAVVSGSLHYDEKILIDLWYKRNPSHEINSNSGEDMFWKTAFMVFEDYVREVSRNDR